jgi:hypothetical protein
VSSIEPFNFVIYDVLMILGHLLKKEELNHRLKVAKVELQGIKCEQGISFNCTLANMHKLEDLGSIKKDLENGIQNSRGICFIKNLAFTEHNQRRF